MRDTNRGHKVARTKSHASIYNIYSSTSRSEKRDTVENYLFHLHNTPLITSEKYYTTFEDNINTHKVDSVSTLFYDLDTIVKRRSLNCSSEKSFVKREENYVKTKRDSNKYKLKHNRKDYEVWEYLKRSMLDSETDSNELKKIPHVISSNFKDTCVWDSDAYIKPHRRFGEKCVKNEQLCNYTKYHTENCSPLKVNRKKRCKENIPILLKNTHKSPKRIRSGAKLRVKLNKNLKGTYELDNLSNISQSPDRKNSTNIQTVKHESSFYKVPVKETITKFAHSSEPEYSESLGYDCKHVSKIKHKRIKKRQITCPNCKEKVQLITTTDDDKGCEHKNYNNYNNSIELSRTLNYKYLPNNYKNDSLNNAGCSHEPKCHVIPLCQVVPSEEVFEKFKATRIPHILRETKACRHNSPCTMEPSCQKTKLLQNDYQYLVDCSHSPRCINIPLCLACPENINCNEFSIKHLDDRDNSECQGSHCKYVPRHEQDVIINPIYQNKIGESYTCCNPCAHTLLMQTNITPKTNFPYQVSNGTTYNSCKLNQSCQYGGVGAANNVQNNPQNVKSEGVIFIRDVGCQFNAKLKKIKRKYEQTKDTKTSSAAINHRDSNRVTNSYRSQCECKNTNIQPGAEVESTDVCSVDESSSSKSSTHKPQTNCTRNRISGFVPNANRSQFVAYSTLTEPVLTNYLSRSIIKGDALHSETFSNISPTRVLSRRSFFKQKYKKIFCVR